MPSVLQPWVEELPLREQGTILAAVRGCDLTPKKPYDAPERQLVAYLRWVALVPADPREVGHDGAFMQDHPPYTWRASDLGHYPEHFYSHLMHGFEVCAYRAPSAHVQADCLTIYYRMVKNLHLYPESKEQMIARLSEDRIASGTIVS